MQVQLTRSILFSFLSGTLLLAACSSGSDSSDGVETNVVTVEPAESNIPLVSDAPLVDDASVDDPRNADYANGVPSNTGIAGRPRASTQSFTERRPESIDLEYLSDSNGFNIAIDSDTDVYGNNFEALGDVNGDGLPDFVISTNKDAWLVFGSGNNLNDIDFENFDSSAGVKLVPPGYFEPVGDVNGDNIDDIGWQTYEPETNATGMVVVFGRNDGKLETAMQVPVMGVDGFQIVNELRPNSVRSITSAGDFNNDGVSDLVIGGFEHDVFDNEEPVAWVLFGGKNIGSAGPIDVSQITSGAGVTFIAPMSAEQIDAVYETSLGGFDINTTSGFDLNADGINDIAIGTDHFDWIANEGSRRTYVVYGGQSQDEGIVDLRQLDGENGILLESTSVPYGADPDVVVAVGDIDGNGYGDLGISSDLANSFVLYSGVGIDGAVANIDALPQESVLRFIDSGDEERIVSDVFGIGDIDDDGVDDLAIVVAYGGASIVYGNAENRLNSFDLNQSYASTATLVEGSEGIHAWSNRDSILALGDINGDGVDDIGFAWKDEYYHRAVKDIGDINGDGVNDLSVGDYLEFSANIYLLRVVYGFGVDGFTGVLAATPPATPLAVVEEDQFSGLLDALNTAGQYAIDTLNTDVSTDLAADVAVPECLSSVPGVQTGEGNGFDCSDSPMAFGYDWGGAKYSGSAESYIVNVSYSEGELTSLNHASNQLSYGYPGSHPYTIYLDFKSDGALRLSNGHEEGPRRTECTIDVATRISSNNASVCLYLVYSATNSLNAIYGEQRSVYNFEYLR